MASTSKPKLADAIHGTNPQVHAPLCELGKANKQFLVEKVIRARIYDSLYWKEHCFSLNGTFPLYSSDWEKADK
jgi:hypothetical protein